MDHGNERAVESIVGRLFAGFINSLVVTLFINFL